MFTTSLLVAASLGISMTGHASEVLTAEGKASIRGCKSWDNTTPDEKQGLLDYAAAYASTEMITTCMAKDPALAPVVSDVTVRGYKCAMLAQAGLYLMNVSYTCEK